MRRSDRVRVVLSTAPDEADAARIARGLVERGLVACVNVVPGIRSIYRWHGSIHDEAEALLVVKTVVERLPEVAAAIRDLHGYEVPEILALSVDAGSVPYLDWLEAAAE